MTATGNRRGPIPRGRTDRRWPMPPWRRSTHRRRSALRPGPRAGGPGSRHLSARGRHGARLRRHPSPAGRDRDTRGLDRLIDYPFADMTITVQAGMTLSALRAILAEKHQRVLVDAPIPIERRSAASTRPTRPARDASGPAGPRPDHRRQLRHLGGRGRQRRRAGRQECRRLRLSQAPDRLDGHAGHHHAIDSQDPPDPRSFRNRLGPVRQPGSPRHGDRRIQHVRYPADRPGGPQSSGRCRPWANRWDYRRITRSWPSASKIMPGRSAGRSTA